MFKRLIVPALVALASSAHAAPQVVLCFGDSLTAGYGLSIDQAWPARLQQKLAKQSLDVEVVNAGLSGDTTAGGRRRIDWLMGRPPDVLVIALGANDGLRGLAVGEMERNLQAIMDRVRQANPTVRILLAGMRAPPGMGEAYGRAFAAVFPRLAERNGIALWPFLLEGVSGAPELNLEDGIHPNSEGHQRIAEMAWQHLLPLLEKPEP